MDRTFRFGCGSEEDPFHSLDGTAGIQADLDARAFRGGVVDLECGRYDIDRSIVLDTPSFCLSGGVWACNTDPNGVFESKFGTKIRMHGTNYPALVIGRDTNPVSGAVIRDLGFQGDISGMDTRPLVNFDLPENAAGLCFYSVRTDQCTFHKLAFCGFAAAVVATGTAELDACLFENLNTDGCGNGFWLSPRASYYTRVQSCVVADNPYYGLYLGGEGKHIHNFEVQDSYFVRNGGGFSGKGVCFPAAVCFDHVSHCAVTNCIFDSPGVFWLYDDNAVQNADRKPSFINIPALRIIGDHNRIRNNTFLNSSDDSIQIIGNGNVLIGNIADGSVRISGEGNSVSSLVFSSPDARLILEEKAKDTTSIYGVEAWRILCV